MVMETRSSKTTEEPRTISWRAMEMVPVRPTA